MYQLIKIIEEVNILKIGLLKDKDFSLLLLGKLVSLVGSIMQDFALSLYVLKITGSGKIFASVLAVGLIPKLFLGPFFGVLVDRFDRKKIIVGLDMLSGLIIGILFFISQNSGLGLLHIYTCSILMSIISCMFNPTINLVIPLIVKKDNLLEANSLNSFVMTLGSLIAPIMAGALYGFYGITPILLINSISFICSSISEMFIDIPSNERSKDKLSFGQFKKDFVEGIVFIKVRRLFLLFAFSGFIINFALNPVFSVGFTFISKMVLKASDFQFGLMDTGLVCGLIFGPLLAGILAKKVSTYKIYSLGIIICGLLLGILSINTMPFYVKLFSSNIIPLVTLCISSILVICTVTIINITLDTMIQQEVPTDIMGRFYAVMTALCMGAIPLGQMTFGVIFDKMPSYIPIIGASVLLMSVGVIGGYIMKDSSETYKEELMYVE